ncbi:MAG: glycosyltransferase family 39 protein, partial [Bacteroidota bacterium]
PQVFFWLLTLYFLVKALPDPDVSKASRNFMFFAGWSAGCALLSKYHAIFLIFGAFFYILFYNRKWFLAKETWGALVMAILCFLPVVFWNIENDFISFTFHEGRVGNTGLGLRPQYFLTEVVGQIFYNNPVNVVIIFTALAALIRKRNFLERSYKRLLLWFSLPLLLIFLFFSLFNSTLPHWTGPSYLGLILIGASFLAEPSPNARKLRLIPWPVILSLTLLAAVAVTGVGQIRYGVIPVRRWKVDDVSLDMYGWKQMGEKFGVLAKWDEDNFLIDRGSPILTFRWFPAANFDYYLARNINKTVYALGNLERIHKYNWINKQRGTLKKGSDAWYIALSDDYEDPFALYGTFFEMILPSDTLYILRGRDTVRKAFTFRLIDLKEDMVFANEPPAKPPSQQRIDTLAYFIKQIWQDRLYLDMLQKKAIKDTVPLEDLIRREAQKMITQSRERRRLPDTVMISR